MKKVKGLGILFLLIVGVTIGYHFVATSPSAPKTSSTYDVSGPQYFQEEESLVLSRMIAKKQGLYFYGFPECPWCQESVPLLTKVLEDQQTRAYTVNIHSDNYQEDDARVLEHFYQSHLGKKSVSVPFLVAINSRGQVKTHVGTVEGHNAKESKLTPKQQEKLAEVLSSLVSWTKS
ncbi:hypothetical protein [Streptococcus hyovaginalis]|uniref:hypothetical protein n=1 Tax=Streptococcus hyovaginalis TaxID=149015 RepID=UPI00147915CC|nr:hypothetical protein [Streptococcus hyovaginalis]